MLFEISTVMGSRLPGSVPLPVKSSSYFLCWAFFFFLSFFFILVFLFSGSKVALTARKSLGKLNYYNFIPQSRLKNV